MRDIWADKWLIEGNKAWMIPGIMNKLLEYDFEKKSCTCLVNIGRTRELLFEKNYTGVYKFGSIFYCLPHRQNTILVYRRTCDEFTEIKFEDLLVRDVEIRYFIDGLDGKLMLFSSGLQSLLILDLENAVIEDEVQIFDREYKMIDKNIKLNNSIYGVSELDGDVYKYDISEKKSTHFNIPNTKKLTTICSDGKKFWMTGTEPYIYEWEEGWINAKCIKLDMADTWDSNQELTAFIESVYINEKAYFFPFRGNEIVVYDGKQTKNIRIAEKNANILIEKNGLDHVSIYSYCRNNRFLGFYNVIEGKQYELDTYDDSINELEINYSLEVIQQKNDYIYSKECSPDGYGSLDYYIKNV